MDIENMVVYTDIPKLLRIAGELECQRSQEKYEQNFHSLHEAESVIREEIEEAKEELERIEVAFNELHSSMRGNEYLDFKSAARRIQASALRLAEEAIQINAMATKATFVILDEP